MENVLKDYPASPTNNARQIVKSYLTKMKSRPSSYLAGALEDKFGIICDYSDKDHGEPPYNANK